MTTYRDPMPDPFTQAVVDTLAAREAREQAREAAWQAGRAEALRAIAAFDVAVAPARLLIEGGRTVDDMRTTEATVSIARGGRRYSFTWVHWTNGWYAHASDKVSTFEAILLAAMQKPEFADALAAMQREDFVDEVTPPAPPPAPRQRSAADWVWLSYVAILILAICSVLAIIVTDAFNFLLG